VKGHRAGSIDGEYRVALSDSVNINTGISALELGGSRAEVHAVESDKSGTRVSMLLPAIQFICMFRGLIEWRNQSSSSESL